MKKGAFLIVLLAVVFLGNAQDSYLTLQAGAAAPIGDLASTDPNSESAGFAKNGKTIGFSLSTPINQKEVLHFVFGYNYTTFNINREEYDIQLESEFRNAYRNLGFLTERFMYQSQFSQHRQHLIFSGIKLNINLSDKIVFFLQPAITYSFFNSADVTLSVSDDSLDVVANSVSDPTHNIGFALGGGFQFELNPKLEFLLKATYNSVEYDLDGENRFRAANGIIIDRFDNVDTKVNSVFLELGFAFVLNKLSSD